MSQGPGAEITVMPPDVLTDDDIPRLYGIDVISDGTIYVSDAWNRRVYRYAQATPAFPTGQLLTTFGAAQTGGDNRGVEVNEARNAVYVVDAEHSDIDVFSLDRRQYRFSFGSEGNGPGQFPGGGRQLAIDDDGERLGRRLRRLRGREVRLGRHAVADGPEPVAGPAGRPARPAA